MKTYEENQFQPTQENVALILRFYELELLDFEPATSGMENCTLIIDTPSGKYVLRIYQQNKNDRGHIQQELEFIDYIYHAGIKTAALPLHNKNGELYTNYDEDGTTWQGILMPFMSGEHTDVYTETLLKDMAVTQSKMHLLAADFKSKFPVSKELHELKETHFIHRINRNALPDKKLRDFIGRAEKNLVKLDPALPRGFCHLDFDYGNLLSDADNHLTAVLDFDDLAMAPYVMCLAYTLWDIYFDCGESMMHFYLKQYNTHRPLNDLEISFIAPIMLFRHHCIGSIETLKGNMVGAELKKYLQIEVELKT